MRCNQEIEFTGKETTEVLKNINDHETVGAELQLACPDIDEYNGVPERFNRTLETKVWSGLPTSVWELAVKAADYTYNRTPHESIEMDTPMKTSLPITVTILNGLDDSDVLASSKYREIATRYLDSKHEHVF